ncbi:hypothetical protein COV16_07005 [Candidatus Woesearchaeota archaeon CG10_big_fil_rev_8_21_14_0_10_34_8]|nr:MAG: hypothetical protein COV16_07005 [Candidatus Woesearchaeota archaeon CG10_big_fil_rev_8_21_14_0_10_34_8]
MENKFEFAWQERSSLLIGIGHHLACKNNMSNIFNVKLDSHLVFWKDNQSHAYFSEESIKRWKEEGKNFLDKEYIKRFLKETKKLRNEFHSIINQLNIDLSKLDDASINNLLSKWYNATKNIQGVYLATQPEGTHYLTEELKKKLKEITNKNNVEEEIKILVSSPELDIIQQEYIDWYNLINKKNTIEKDFTTHAKNYASFFFNSYRWDDIISYLSKRLKNFDKNIIKQDVLHLYNEKQKTLRIKKELLLDMPNEIEQYSKTLEEIGQERLKMKNCWSGAELLALDLFKEIAKRKNVELENIFTGYTIDDLHDLVTKNKFVEEDEIKRRMSHVIFHVNNGEHEFKTGTEAENKIKEIFGITNHEKELQVKGMIANSGLITGRAKVVLVEDIKAFSEALDNFEQEDILITTMTSPNMIPLIKKAAGIVTNEGGICSHAAVISREITKPRRKPCIVGTKDATRVFKTGDYVLINGETGEVQKITREKHELMKDQLQKQLETR